MEDKEIIKALECCASECFNACDNCPFYKQCENDEQLSKFALDLINRQQAEKEALIAGQETMSKYIEEQQAEIERLQKENNQFADIGKMYSEIKSDAIKKFVARLIIVDETTAKYCEANEKVVRVTDIEDLVKEMVGDTE